MDPTLKQNMSDSEQLKEVVFTGVEGGQEWTICCWDLKARTVKTSYKGTSSKAHTLCVFNGEYAISADACKPLIHVWPLNRRDHCLRMRSPGLVTALTVTSDGIYCAAATSYKIFIWLVSTGELLSVFDSNQVNCLLFTRNSKYLLSGGGAHVNVWSFTKVLTVARTENKHTEPVHKFTHGNSLTGLKCGSATVLTSADRTVNMWSLRDGSLLWTTVLDSLVSTIEWSVKEDRAYAGTYDGEIYEIDTANEKENPKKFVHFRRERKEAGSMVRKKDRRVTCLSLSTDGRILVAGSLKGKVCLWNTNTRHLVTTLCLNANSLVTSCLVTFMPSNLEKPVHPIARFQESLAEEGEGKVKFLLEKQKTDSVCLNLELGDDKFEKFVSKGFSLLDEFGKAPNKAEQYARNWIRLTEQIVSGLHEVLDQIYANVGSGSSKYKRPSPGQVTLQPCTEDDVTQFSFLCVQFEKLCEILSIILCGFGLEFRVVVDFPLRYIIDVLCRAVSVTPPQLLKRPTPDRINLAEMVHRLHIPALEVLRYLMISVKSLLLPYVELLNNLLLVQCFTWSKMNSSDDTKKKQAFSGIRRQAYETIETSLLYGLSGDSKSFEMFFKTVVAEAVTDARHSIEAQKKNETKSEQAMNRANSYWLQVAKNKLKSKNKKSILPTQRIPTDSTDKPVNEDECIAIQALNSSALRVLKRLIVSEGRFLPRAILEMITGLLSQLYPRMGVVTSNCSDAFHELVRSVVMVATSLPFPMELPLDVTTPGLYNDNAEELRQFYISSLRSGVRMVAAEEPTRAIESDGKLEKFVESIKKIPAASKTVENVLQHTELLTAKRKFPADVSDLVCDDSVEPFDDSSAKRKKLEIDDDVSSEIIEHRNNDIVSEESSSKELFNLNQDVVNDKESIFQNKDDDEEITKEVTCRDIPSSCDDLQKEISSLLIDKINTEAFSTTCLEFDLETENDNTESDDVKEMMKSFVCASPDRC